MSNLLDDRTAVVTGAASGIGRGIALSFAEHGAKVVVADRQVAPREGGKPTHDRINAETDANAMFVHCDVTNYEELETAVDAAGEFGGLDVMVNNAGVFSTNEFLETTEDAYDELMNVNAKATFFGSQVAAKGMVENGGGSIINISSVAGVVGNGAYSIYSMSKAAVQVLTYSLAAEFGSQGIRVNAINPGAIETALTAEDTEEMDDDAVAKFRSLIPQQRRGRPDDVAGVAVFLASDLASYVNAESILVDGGYTNTG